MSEPTPISDNIIAAISTMLTNAGYSNVNIATEGYVRDYNNLPIVEIAPVERPEIKFIGFRIRNVKQKYRLMYITGNNLNTTLPGNLNTFKITLVNLFEGLFVNTIPVSPLQTAGAWQAVVVDDYEMQMELLNKGYTYSRMLVLIDWVEN